MKPNHKNVCVLIFNRRTVHGSKVIYKKGLRLPNKCFICFNFNENKIIGEAYNFRIEADKIFCDIYLKDDIYKTVAPSIMSHYEGTSSVMHKLNYLSIVTGHAISALNNNLIGA